MTTTRKRMQRNADRAYWRYLDRPGAFTLWSLHANIKAGFDLRTAMTLRGLFDRPKIEVSQ